MHHQRSKLVTQSRSNACALIAVNSAVLSCPALGGQRGAHRAQPHQRRPVRRLHHAGWQWPVADHQSGKRKVVGRKRFHGQRGVVEGAELGGGHHQYRGAEISGEISQRHASVGELDEQATGALDQGQLAWMVHCANEFENGVAAGQRPGRPALRRPAAPVAPGNAPVRPLCSARSAGSLRRGRRPRPRSRSAPACRPRRRYRPVARPPPGPRWRWSCRPRSRSR